jgi:hypothetical protein
VAFAGVAPEVSQVGERGGRGERGEMGERGEKGIKKNTVKNSVPKQMVLVDDTVSL